MLSESRCRLSLSFGPSANCQPKISARQPPAGQSAAQVSDDWSGSRANKAKPTERSSRLIDREFWSGMIASRKVTRDTARARMRLQTMPAFGYCVRRGPTRSSLITLPRFVRAPCDRMVGRVVATSTPGATTAC